MGNENVGTSLYLSSIAYQLGESASIKELRELDDESLAMFQALGLSRYSRSSEQPAALAFASARKTLLDADVAREDIGVIVYATSTLASQNHSRDDIRQLCCDLELERAFTMGIFAWECSNVYLAATVAADALRSGRARHALVITADVCLPGESRILPPNLTVLSDGASSFILSIERDGHPCFEVGGMGSFSDPGLAKVDPTTQLADFFKRTVAGISSAARQAMDSGGIGVPEISAVVTNNYNLSIMRTFATQVGYDIKKAYFNNLSRFAHAYAADSLINLNDLDASGGLVDGSRCLLIASGPTAWGAITLTKHDGR